MGALKSGLARAAAGFVALAVWTTMAMPAAAQGGACPSLARSVRANWDNNLIGLSSARRAIERANQDLGAFASMAADVAAAQADCSRLLQEKSARGSIWAHECVGDASYLLAKHRPGQSAQQRDADYAAAYCAYRNEEALAKGNGQRERERRGAALEGQGNVLHGQSELGGANASRYLFDAIAAYGAAAALQPSSQRYLKLARAQGEAGNAREASATYDKLQALPADASFPTLVRAAALREQARIQQKDPAAFSAASVRELWNRARSMDPSAESHFAYAKSFFDAGDLVTARSAFNEASNAPSTPGGTTSYANEGAYYVAVIDARAATTSGQWAQVLASAKRAGPGDTRYRRLTCMAYIGAGGEPLTRDDPAASCAGDNTAEGQLLSGMYMLRRAQHLPTTCKPGTSATACRAQYQANLETLISSGALGAFQRGKGLATNEAVFNWLEQPGATEPKLKEALEFGETLGNSLLRIDGCNRSPTGSASAMEVFRRMDLMGCRPTN